jgi:hypothetical protein
MKVIFALVVLFTGFICVAQVATPTSAVTVAATATPNSTLATISGAMDKIPTAATIPAWAIAAFAFVAEIAVRIYPTANPTSFFLWGSQLLGLLGLGLTKISALLDLALQNTTPPAAPKV